MRAQRKQDFETTNVPVERRLEFWSEVTRKVITPLSFERQTLSSEDFGGRIMAQSLDVEGSLNFVDVSAPAHVVRRTKQDIASSDEDFLIIIMQAHGQGEIMHNGHQIRLNRGDLTIVDSSKEFDLVFDGPMRQLLLRIPSDIAESELLFLERTSGLCIDGRKGSGRVASEFLKNFLFQASNMETPERSALLRPLLGVLNTSALALMNNNVRGLSTSLAFKVNQVRLYVDEHLRDPELSASSIAEAQGISLRYLNRMFQDEDVSVGRLLWLRRLEKCRQDLENPRLSGKSITEISYSWGFSSSSHFSRSFREQFGVSPRDARAAAALKNPS